MSLGPIRSDPDVISDERFPATGDDRVRVRGHIRYSKVGREGGPAVSRFSIEDIQQVVLGIEPPVVEYDAKEPMRHSHPWKKVVMVSAVIGHSDRTAPGGTSVEALA